jgi:hypothetical protein
VSPLAIITLTVLSIGLYFVAFMLLVKLFFALHGAFYRGKGPITILWFFLALIVWIPVFVLDLIHRIGCLFLGIQMASALRDWWHAGAKR